jgi:hypothetical protein
MLKFGEFTHKIKQTRAIIFTNKDGIFTLEMYTELTAIVTRPEVKGAKNAANLWSKKGI